jgi:3-hydroxyacyl-CoA dehydrogenase
MGRWCLGPHPFNSTPGVARVETALRLNRALPALSKAKDRIFKLGRFGQKTGAGWYDYNPGHREAVPSERVCVGGGMGAAGLFEVA